MFENYISFPFLNISLSKIIKLYCLPDVQQANPSGRPTLRPVNTDDTTNPIIKASIDDHPYPL